MNVENKTYSLSQDEANKSIALSGSLRLNGLDEYMPVLNTLSAAIAESEELTLDITELQFLNSSGIAMLSKFIIEARAKDSLRLTIKGSGNIPWQGKSLKNLQRLYPALVLELV